MSQYATISSLKIEFKMYDQLRKDQSLQLDLALKQAIFHYKTNEYDKIEKQDQFQKMLNDFGNQSLKLKLKNTKEFPGIKLFKLYTFLRQFVEDFYDIFLLVKKKEGNPNQQINSYLKDIQNSEYFSNHQQFEDLYFMQYLVYHDRFWQESLKDLVQESYDREIQMAKDQKPVFCIKVKLQGESTKEMYLTTIKSLINYFKKLGELEYNEEVSQFELLKSQLIKIIFASFIKFRHTNAQKLFFSEEDRLNLTKFEPIVNENDKNLVTFSNPYQILPKGLDICLEKLNGVSEEVLLNYMDQLLFDKKYYFISYEEEFSDQNDSINIPDNLSQQRKLKNFFTYFYYYRRYKKEEQRLQYAFVPEEILTEGKTKMEQECFGIEAFLNNSQMKILHDDFKNPLSFYGCRGPLIYGPPGTGKTYIIQRMISSYEIHLVFDGNSSTFQGSLVGQGSRLLQIYFNRAKAIPWQACAAHIGEIEQLVKKKDKEGGGGGSQEVLNKLLELMDGTETVGNVKVFSTTNHVEMIEEAILSRFRQVYLGKSNSTLRNDWIVWYLMNIKKQGGQQSQQFKKIMKGFFSKENGEYFQFLSKSDKEQKTQLVAKIKDIVDYSINFSTRQLKDLMQNITSKMIFKEITLKSSSRDKLNMLTEFCKTLGVQNFLFGNKILPQLMFDTNTKTKFADELEEKFLRIANYNSRDNINSSLQSEQKYDHSKIIFIDLSTDPWERINILKQREKTFIDMAQYEQLKILIYSQLKIEKWQDDTSQLTWSQDKLQKLLSQIQSIKDPKINNLQSSIEYLEKLDLPNIQSSLKQEIQDRLKSYKSQYELKITLSKKFKQDIQRYLDENRFQNLHEELQELQKQISEMNEEKKIKNLIESYSVFIEKQIDKYSTSLFNSIDHQLLLEFTLEQIVNQNKYYKLEYCNLQETRFDYLLLLLSYFIKNGGDKYIYINILNLNNQQDFSKVDMVDYHSCERNKVHDINSFKNYISNITQEAREEEKSLIVYNLDEILDVNYQEDAELEKDYKQMAKKIFETINLDASNSKQWTILITKNYNSLFGLVKAEGERRYLCNKTNLNQDNLAEEDDQCKQHLSDKFFIIKQIDMYKKFEDNWYSTYLQEYDKRKEHIQYHQQQNEQIKGCTYCENKQKFNAQSYKSEIFDLQKESFDILKGLSIIPSYYKSYDQVMNYKKPLDICDIKQKIDKQELFNNDVKRICCEASFNKEECNSHTHIEDTSEQKEEKIQEKIQNIIQDKIIKFLEKTQNIQN